MAIKKKTDDGKEIKYKISQEEAGRLIKALFNNDFNVSKACKEANIERNAYYYSLRVDEDFREMLNYSKDILASTVSNGIMEGLNSNDLIVKHKYLELLSKSNLLAKLLNIELGESKVTFNITKEDIINSL